MKNYFDNTGILDLINKYKLHLSIIVLIAIIASTIFSGEMFIKPKYKAVAILYPSNIIPYSEESSTEQMLQLLQSNDIRQKIITKYRFPEKFNIDLSTPSAKAKLYNIYDESVIIKKTEYESVKIEVWDTNPDTAAAMANEIIDLLSKKSRELQTEKSRELLKVYADQLKYKLAGIDSMENRMKELRVKYGILDYQTQAKEASKQYLKAIAKGSKAGLNEIDVLMRNLEEKGGEFLDLQGNILRERIEYSRIKGKYDEVLSDVAKELTYANVVTKPEAPDKKSSPVRWIIVMITTISTFFLALVILIIIDSKNRRIIVE